jgi:hypothetical protein
VKWSTPYKVKINDNKFLKSDPVLWHHFSYNVSCNLCSILSATRIVLSRVSCVIIYTSLPLAFVPFSSFGFKWFCGISPGFYMDLLIWEYFGIQFLRFSFWVSGLGIRKWEAGLWVLGFYILGNMLGLFAFHK